VWVTFDDGVEDVVRVGLPLLQRYRVPATLFVCPGLVGTDQLQWWEAVERAGSLGLLASSTAEQLRELKAAEDPARRLAIAAIEERLRTTPAGATGRQLSTADLRAWLAAGNDLGNHSFDHPRLDRCTPAEQEQQVRQAHDWLTELLGAPPVLFAWPNGDAAEPALTLLRSLDYRAVLVCDHRLARRSADPMALSRVRIDADDELPRLRAVASGAHPALFAAQHRLTHRT
jgi:peptidoglycan/xylan/chitin deacetylase (PgdA/CDA1 family)